MGNSSEPTVEITEPSALEAVTVPVKVEPVASMAYEDAIAEAAAATDEIAQSSCPHTGEDFSKQKRGS